MMKAFLSFLVLCFVSFCLAEDNSVISLSRAICEVSDPEQADVPNYRSCMLSNVCYDNGEWNFYEISGLGTKSQDYLHEDPLVNLGGYANSPTWSIDNFVHTPVQQSGTRWVTKPTFLYYGVSHLYHRFVMDDMFGLWWMKHKWNLQDPMDNLIIWYGEGRYHDLIEQFFTSNPVQSISDFDDQRVCFSKLIVGPSAFQISGPGGHQLRTKQRVLVKRFRDDLLRVLSVSATRYLPKYPEITIVMRKDDTKIANIQQLGEEIARRYPFSVRIVVPGDMPIRDQMRLFRQTTITISAHSSDMVNLLWMHTGTAVIELFPYKFYQSIYKTLATYNGVLYHEWRNEDPDKATFHEELLGDIDPSVKEEIIGNSESSTTNWKASQYWQSQDTEVDIPAILDIIDNILAEGIHNSFEFDLDLILETGIEGEKLGM